MNTSLAELSGGKACAEYRLGAVLKDTSLAELLGGKACAVYMLGSDAKDTSLAGLSGGGLSGAVQSSRSPLKEKWRTRWTPRSRRQGMRRVHVGGGRDGCLAREVLGGKACAEYIAPSTCWGRT